jgi:hypothetical protein
MANNFEKLVRAYVDQAQELNDAATELLIEVSIDGSTGVQLDGLGQLIGLERQGLDDETYKAALKAWVQVNTSGGTIEQLNEVVRLATSTTEADAAFELVEDFWAGFKINFLELLPTGIGYMVAEAMYQAKAAGVYGIFEFFQTEPVFAFDGAGGSKFDGGYYLKTAIRNRAARESETL